MQFRLASGQLGRHGESDARALQHAQAGGHETKPAKTFPWFRPLHSDPHTSARGVGATDLFPATWGRCPKWAQIIQRPIRIFCCHSVHAPVLGILGPTDGRSQDRG